MPKRDGSERALPGSLHHEAFADLRVYREFLDNRDRAMLGLYGKRLPRSQLRDHLVRAVLIEFGGGHVRNMSFYQKGLAHAGSQSAVRNEIARLVEVGLLVLDQAGDDRRAAEVVPTQKLVDWYSMQLPRLYDEIGQFLALREAVRNAGATPSEHLEAAKPRSPDN